MSVGGYLVSYWSNVHRLGNSKGRLPKNPNRCVDDDNRQSDERYLTRIKIVSERNGHERELIIPDFGF